MGDSLDLLLKAYTIRCTEETLLDLFSKGKLFGTTHTCVGQELSAVAIANALHDEDIILSNHRCHGHYIAKTDDVEGLLAEIMGKATGVCGGIGGSQHLCGKNFYSNGIQGGMVPVAAGIALGKKIGGEDVVTTVCIGDGTLGEGVVYESLNMASKWSLPLLVVLEDNGYSQSTCQAEVISGSIVDRAAAFGIKVYEGSTWDYEKLLNDMISAADYVRNECKPVFFKVATYRLRAHSKGDDDRCSMEIEKHDNIDPLNIFLDEDKKNNHEIQQQLSHIRDRISNAVEKAEQDEFAQLKVVEPTDHNSASLSKTEQCSDNQLVAINRVLSSALNNDSRCILLGEDIRMPYGGAFKVTKGLSDQYSERVINTPISEAGIVGIGNGLALAGFRPVIELMFGDFATLAFDQLVNHAAKFRMMYNEQVSVPVIVRTPMGAGRGYGPTHSQSLEKHLVGVPGLHAYILHHRVNIQSFYSFLLQNTRDPSIVIENKLLYAVRGDREINSDFEVYETDEQYPTTVVKSEDEPDITICAFGRMALLAEDAAFELYEEEEIVVELFFPLSISPLNGSPIMESVKKSRQLVIIEEGTPSYNLGSEIVARLHENWDETEAFKSRRLSSREMAVPSSGPMEREYLPSKEAIIACCKEIFND